jgi:hypothetical protein
VAAPNRIVFGSLFIWLKHAHSFVIITDPEADEAKKPDAKA